MRIEEDIKLDFKDVLLKPKRSKLVSRKDVDLNRTFKFMHTGKSWTGVPIITSNMDTSGTIEMADELEKFDAMVALHKHYTKDELVEYFMDCPQNTFYSMGITDSDFEKYKHVRDSISEFLRPNKVCIDVANGYTEQFNDFVKKFRDTFPDTIIMAGTVVTGNMTEELLLSGADIVRVGIGSGSRMYDSKTNRCWFPAAFSGHRVC